MQTGQCLIFRPHSLRIRSALSRLYRSRAQFSRTRMVVNRRVFFHLLLTAILLYRGVVLISLQRGGEMGVSFRALVSNIRELLIPYLGNDWSLPIGSRASGFFSHQIKIIKTRLKISCLGGFFGRVLIPKIAVPEFPPITTRRPKATVTYIPSKKK